MTFQALDDKSHNFLKLLDNKNNLLEPTYSKGRIWLKYFGHWNLLYIRVTKAIINHTLISKYQLIFFPMKISSVHIVLILLKLDVIFYMSAKDTITTEIWEGIQ